VKNKLLKGWAPTSGGTSFKVHLDGYNQLPYLTGQHPRVSAASSTTSTTTACWCQCAYDNWKAVFCEQRQPGGFKVWSEPFVCLRVPKIFNLRMDPV
jgi:arylsulfatase